MIDDYLSIAWVTNRHEIHKTVLTVPPGLKRLLRSRVFLLCRSRRDFVGLRRELQPDDVAISQPGALKVMPTIDSSENAICTATTAMHASSANSR